MWPIPDGPLDGTQLAGVMRLAQAAYASWGEVSAEAGAELVIETGGIDIFPPRDSFDREAYCGAMDACGVTYERLDGAEAMRRFPELHVEEATEVLFQERTGIAAAARANAAHQPRKAGSFRTVDSRTGSQRKT